MIKAVRSALRVVSRARRPYRVLSAAYFGIVICAMVAAAFARPLQQELLGSVGESFSEGPSPRC
jgi:hypothetical protein